MLPKFLMYILPVSKSCNSSNLEPLQVSCVTQTNNPIAACRRLHGRIMRLVWEGTGWRLEKPSLCFTQTLAAIQAGETSPTTWRWRRARDSRLVSCRLTHRQTEVTFFSFDYVKVSLCFASWRGKSKYTRMLFSHLWTYLMKTNKLLLWQRRAQKLQRWQISGFQS